MKKKVCISSQKTKAFMRFITSVLCVCAFSATAISVSAKNTAGEVKYGTPSIDGKLDEIYKSSASTSLKDNFFYPWSESKEDEIVKEQADASAETYFLWDEDYFYTCTVVKDNDVFAKDPTYYTTPYPWQDDGVELYLDYKDESFTLHNDANGIIMYAYGGSSGGTKAFADVKGIGADFGHPAIPNTEVKSKYVTALTDDGYIIETALALKNDAKFKAGDIMKCALQVNDIYSSEGKKGYALGSQDCYNSGITLTFAEQPDTAASADPSNSGNTNTSPSPQTSDIGVYAAAAAIGSAACIVFMKQIEKREKTK